ncbi:MAG: hypothetical protein HQL38_20215, partial [Alphaproteobacteria bacterium]|nr:hypothetical protein [Alphaproteobacteria bacterium]
VGAIRLRAAGRDFVKSGDPTRATGLLATIEESFREVEKEIGAARDVSAPVVSPPARGR